MLILAKDLFQFTMKSGLTVLGLYISKILEKMTVLLIRDYGWTKTGKMVVQEGSWELKNHETP